ncbi:hypothetical protein TcWFU_010140 [Taenia crassiceps]|uniref:Uncharacterized protein n=1 Tax=Taenia crassiceps TaxID=6207 RepID=A0ABR4Q4M0_9CEST
MLYFTCLALLATYFLDADFALEIDPDAPRHRYPSEEVSLTIPPAEDGGSFVTTTTVESILHLANPVTTTPVESASWSLGFVSLGTARVGTSIASTSGSTYNALDGAALFTSIILILSLSLMLH